MTTETPTAALVSIDLPANVRSQVGDTSELEGSISNIGLIEPLVVRSNGNGRYELLAGRRRYTALANLGHTTAPIHVINSPDEDPELARIKLQLVENLQREELDPVDEASGYAQLKRLGLRQRQIASEIGRSEAHISKRLSLLKLPDEVIDLHEAGRLTTEDLYELTKVESAGADLTPIVEQVAATDRDDTPDPHGEIEQMVKQAIKRQTAEEKLSARKGEYEAKGVAQVRVVDTDEYGRPQLPKDRLRYGELDLDHDAHLKEPCALLCLWEQWGTDYESQHCTDRRRHGPNGASDLRLPTTPGKGVSPEAKAKTKARRRSQALTKAAEGALAARQPARDRILDRMAVLYLDRLEAVAHKRAAKFLGVEAEIRDEYKGLSKLYEEADSPNRVRILFAAVLAHGHQNSISQWSTPDETHLEFLADIGHPVDLEGADKSADVDSVVDEAIQQGKAEGR